MSCVYNLDKCHNDRLRYVASISQSDFLVLWYSGIKVGHLTTIRDVGGENWVCSFHSHLAYYIRDQPRFLFLDNRSSMPSRMFQYGNKLGLPSNKLKEKQVVPSWFQIVVVLMAESQSKAQALASCAEALAMVGLISLDAVLCSCTFYRWERFFWCQNRQWTRFEILGIACYNAVYFIYGLRTIVLNCILKILELWF